MLCPVSTFPTAGKGHILTILPLCWLFPQQCCGGSPCPLPAAWKGDTALVLRALIVSKKQTSTLRQEYGNFLGFWRARAECGSFWDRKHHSHCTQSGAEWSQLPEEASPRGTLWTPLGEDPVERLVIYLHSHPGTPGPTLNSLKQTGPQVTQVMGLGVTAGGTPSLVPMWRERG